MLEIDAAGFRFLARWEEELRAGDGGGLQADAPDRGPDHPLPLERRVELDPVGRPRARASAPRTRRATRCPGEIALYPGGVSETELLFPYGYCCFASKAGQLAANHFATLVEGQENLRELGRLTLWEGAQPIRFSERGG